MDKAARELDLRWLFTTRLTTDSSQQAAASDLSPHTLTATPYAHLVATLLLAGPSKAVRLLAGTLLKSLWLLESVKALTSKSPASAQHAQQAQRVMLALLLHWAPSLAAYPDSVQPYYQLLTWIVHVTPTLPEHLKTEAGSAKKKAGGAGGKPSAKGSAALDKAKSSSSSSSSNGNSTAGSSSLRKQSQVEGVFQDVVTASAVTKIFAAVKRYNAVLANHIHGGLYQSLQVSHTPTRSLRLLHQSNS